jgi:hypothetical protein
VGEYITSFRRYNGGVWTCIRAVTIDHPLGRIHVAAGSSFSKGTCYMGIDLAAWLDEQFLGTLKKQASASSGSASR